MRRAMAGLVLAGACTAAGGAVLPERFTGRWAAEPAWCATETGTVPEAPILIAPDRIAGYESSCGVVGVISLPGPDGDVRARLSCLGEGMASEDTRELRLMADGRLAISFGPGAPVLLERCPA